MQISVFICYLLIIYIIAHFSLYVKTKNLLDKDACRDLHETIGKNYKVLHQQNANHDYSPSNLKKGEE